MSIVIRPELIADLKRFEGEPGTGAPALTAYADPISHGPPWTNGWGHTGRDVYPGLVITEATAELNLTIDADKVAQALDGALPWLDPVDPVRQDAFINLGFNLGVHGLLEFNTFLALAKTGCWSDAAVDLEQTAWYRQVNGDGRGDFVCDLIRTGARP